MKIYPNQIKNEIVDPDDLRKFYGQDNKCR